MAIRDYCYHHTLGEDSSDFHVVAPLALELPNKTPELRPRRSNDLYWTFAPIHELKLAVRRAEVVGTAEATAASDHLPLVVDLSLGEG